MNEQTPMTELSPEKLRQYLRRYHIRRTSPAFRVTSISAHEIHRAASRYLSGKMIDVGCGTKAKSDLVGHAVQEHVGMDHIECSHNHENIDIFGTCYEIPVEEASFDSLICTAVLEHLEEPAQALQEMFRVLKPGGTGVFTMPLYWHLHEEPRDFFRYTRYGLEHLFRNAGYEIIELKPLSGFWTTFLTQFNYYLWYKVRRGILKYPVYAMVAVNNFLAWLLDRGYLADHRFTWAYLVVARRPGVVE